jgi:hypothetical protein
MSFLAGLRDHSTDERGKFELARATAAVYSIDFDCCTAFVQDFVTLFPFIKHPYRTTPPLWSADPET